jgi:hypothetical protein
MIRTQKSAARLETGWLTFRHGSPRWRVVVKDEREGEELTCQPPMRVSLPWRSFDVFLWFVSINTAGKLRQNREGIGKPIDLPLDGRYVLP